MAEVYAARVRGEAGFQKLVALKRMLPHLTDDDRFVTMFMDEGRLAANISSPNVVSTLDLGRADDGSLYLVMELVLGTTLSTLLRNAAQGGVSIPIAAAVELIAQAAQGLHDAHEARTPFGAPLHIVHRDVSPQNILVGTDGRVRITDFGVARAILRRTKTSTGEFKGKLSYFSPEQCADKALDRRSDVFSIGVVAWETLTTRRLFHAENPLAVLERVTRMPIPLAHTVNPAVPPEISAVVATALERDRDARFSNAADFAQALRAAARATVGDDRANIAELVQKLGGETLERVERQLRQSLAQPSDRPPEPLDDQTEISSGIVFRSEDGTVVPATPRAPAMVSSTGASFVGPLELAPASATPTARPASKLPYVIAIVVAALGLAAGAVIGVLALTGDEPREVPHGGPRAASRGQRRAAAGPAAAPSERLGGAAARARGAAGAAGTRGRAPHRARRAPAPAARSAHARARPRPAAEAAHRDEPAASHRDAALHATAGPRGRRGLRPRHRPAVSTRPPRRRMERAPAAKRGTIRPCPRR
ncbi:MAG: serine/threonine protein kinase [Sandaracinaceae bacterium]|nr:serine/threonine protein kinase [Sandaracinaceae bacterium]